MQPRVIICGKQAVAMGFNAYMLKAHFSKSDAPPLIFARDPTDSVLFDEIVAQLKASLDCQCSRLIFADSRRIRIKLEIVDEGVRISHDHGADCSGGMTQLQLDYQSENPAGI